MITFQNKKNNSKVMFFLKKNFLNIKKIFSKNFIALFKKNTTNKELYKKIEEELILSDIGISTTKYIIGNLFRLVNKNKINNNSEIFLLLKNEMLKILKNVEIPLNINKKPFIILMIGINGVGKTTTVSKLALHYKEKGKSVKLVAGDTFRAAGIQQLQELGYQNNIPVISKPLNSDSASVIFEAMQNLKESETDLLIIDTAGRLQNKLHLMEELKKIIKTIKKIDLNAPNEIMLVIDANTGQNAINQAKMFHQLINITGITLTKLDGTAKGGVIFPIANEFNIPIRYISTGNKNKDFQIFNANKFINAIFEKNA